MYSPLQKEPSTQAVPESNATNANLSRTNNTSLGRPGGTGPVGPAMAGPIFELGRIFF